MMRVLAISDLHGYLPDIPECDLFLLGGDYCPGRNLEQQRKFIHEKFTPWLRKIPARHIVGIAGNHDFIFQQSPEIAEELPWIYLEDSEAEVETVRIYGSPWTPLFYDWAFMADEENLRMKFERIPEGLDVLLTHGPAYRHLDKTEEGVRAGSFALLERINLVKPDSHVFGHIHEASGVEDGEFTRFHNVSHVDAKYRQKRNSTTIHLKAA